MPVRSRFNCLTSLFTFLCLALNCQGVVKEFVGTRNWNASASWAEGYAPCGGERLVLGPHTGALVHLPPGGLILKEMVLPLDGGLAFPRDGEVKMSGDRGAACRGPNELHFKEDFVQEWAVWQNWRTLDKKNMVGEGGPAQPHSERLPCIGDIVRFPPGSNFAVRTPPFLQFIHSIQVENQTFNIRNRNNFYRQLSGNIIGGKIYMINRGNPVICQIMPPIMAEVCEATVCEPAACQNPISPPQHCCPLCGASFNFSRPLMHPYDLDNLREVVEEEYLAAGAQGSGVSWSIHFLGSNRFQILAVDGEGSAALESRMRLMEALQRRISSIYNLPALPHMLTSGTQWGAGSGWWSTLLGLAGVLVMLTIVSLVYYPPNALIRIQHMRPFDFARFENRSREGSVVQLGASQLSLNKSFDNPMYAAMATKMVAVTEADDEIDLQTKVDPNSAVSYQELMKDNKDNDEDEVF